jgi:uncharacterized membrane protein
VSRASRIEGVDIARGLAVVLMIQAHAYDAWVAPQHKTSAAYLLTRALATLPLPTFLALSGAGVALRVEAGRRAGETAAQVRRDALRRAIEVVATGYAANALYASIDGFTGLETFLRVDVLQAIGLSLAALVLLGVRGSERPEPRALAIAASALAVAPALLCPWLSSLGGYARGPARFVVALFVDVPSLTSMPLVPLVSWAGLGALSTLALLRVSGPASSRSPSRADASSRFLWSQGAVSLLVALAASLATAPLVALLGGTLTRAHPAIWLNLIDLGARALALLSFASLASNRLPSLARSLLLRLGRGSMFAYVFHIPFCYGLLGRALRGGLDLATATAGVLALVALTALAVFVRDLARTRLPALRQRVPR